MKMIFRQLSVICARIQLSYVAGLDCWWVAGKSGMWVLQTEGEHCKEVGVGDSISTRD